MNKLSFRSVKSQLFVMVFVMAFFAAGIIVYSGVSFRNEKISEALKDSAMLADSLSNEHEKMVADVRQLMLTLVQLPDIKNHNAAGMHQILKEVLSANPKYSNIFIADRAGRVLASAVAARDTNVSDRRYFINALATGRLSSGEFIRSRFTGKPVLAFGYPFKDRQGEILGIIVMGIDMSYYKTLLDTMPLPSGSSYLLLDHKGTIMTRGINPTDFIGEQYDPEGFKRMAEGPDKDTFVAVAHDGIKRFISYRKIRLEGERAPYMYIRSGIPVATALSVANKTLMRNLTLFTASLCFVIVFILLIAKHSIIDRIALLETASKRLADGELHVKISDLVAGGELGRLGLTFDHMAGQIALREEALRESEKRYYALFEQSPDGVLLIDTAGKMIEFNEMAHRQLGYSREEFAKLNLSDIDPVESPEEIRDKIGKILKEGKAEFEVKHTTKRGEVRDVNIITKVIVLSGRPVMYAIWHDITARKQAEGAVKSSEELLNTILDNVGAAIFIKDTKYRYTYANSRVCEVFGRSAEEILGKNDREFFSAESVEEIMRSDRPVIERGETVSREETGLASSDKVPRTYWTVKLPLRDSMGTITGLCGISTDITEGKRAEDKIRQSEAKYRNLFDLSTDGIFIIDLDGNFLDVNSTAYTRLGYTKEEMLSLHISGLDDPAFASRVSERQAQIREQGAAVFESAHLRKDGTAMPVEVNSRLLDYEGRQVYFSVIRDITERKIAEEQIMVALREKEILLKEIHHRVKNNLNVIASLLSLQSRYIAEPAVIGIFEECRNRINSMALIHEKLYQTRNFSRIDFKEYLNSLISMLSSSYIDMRGKVSMRTEIQDLSLDIDTAMTCGLITNELVTNCLKHAFPGNRGGVINVSLFSEGGRHILSVRDNGIGLPDQFDLKSTNTLGLQMVKMLTKKLEGTMHVAANSGTEIRISF